MIIEKIEPTEMIPVEELEETVRGTGGFGYDPLFYLPELDRTMAEIDLETKLRLSHRGRALATLLPLLLKVAPASP